MPEILYSLNSGNPVYVKSLVESACVCPRSQYINNGADEKSQLITAMALIATTINACIFKTQIYLCMCHCPVFPFNWCMT